MSESQQYDAVIIGSGQGGNPLAKALAAAGRKTAVIEREHVGGSCVNEGCTPTKTMVASARAAYIARRAADYGVETGPVSVDMSVVRGRKRDIVDKFRSGGEKGLEKAENLDLIMGEARFIGPKELEVQLNDGGTLEIAAENIFINVGARPGEVPV
ncbi:MAG: FAD-dependent oxidoreductase, partial [Rubrobacteraceae bacterium]